eukprot:TRINITY_DN3504_c0_g1_i1.p1 TRINITY_DN3504_c0_g1~~TRINITY_DN3504_c0_g1_i1.p1  ORF type:complete len:116 (+),score=9.43 TRINITY_DN3504_c0_g1_i1:1-348(+)
MLRSTSTQWSGPFLKSKLCTGQGVVVEGDVKEVRVHSMFVSSTVIDNQEDNLPTRFTVLTVEPERAYPRILRGGSDVDYTCNVKGQRDYVEPALLSHDQLVARIGGTVFAYHAFS